MRTKISWTWLFALFQFGNIHARVDNKPPQYFVTLKTNDNEINLWIYDIFKYLYLPAFKLVAETA